MKTTTFDSALYYELPKQYKGHVEFLRAISMSQEGKANLPADLYIMKGKKEIMGRKAYETVIKRDALPILEQKILKSIQESEGDLVLLEDPQVKITNFGKIYNNEYTAPIVPIDFIISVNGILYKTNGINK